ncbi:MAG: hypothetical protein IJH38_04490, partial [Clostridia bacterium]|nr:hypothetical protein [Clostridia bacterium]
PMAVVSIGGLTYATLMTLFIVPVLYDLVNGKTMRAREIQMIKEAAGMIGDEALDDDRVSADAGREAPAAQTPDIKSAEPAGAAPPPEPSPLPEEAAAEPAAPEAKPAPEAPVPAARPLKIRFRP